MPSLTAHQIMMYSEILDYHNVDAAAQPNVEENGGS
jgi:hypothetical protein